MVIMAQAMEEGINIVKESEKHFDTIVTEWLGTPAVSMEKLTNDLTILMTYLRKIKTFGIISQKRLAYEVGNTRRDQNFYRYASYLEQAGCMKVIRDSASICKSKGKEWMEFMHINPKFKNPPVLYSFQKLLSETKIEKILKEGVKK